MIFIPHKQSRILSRSRVWPLVLSFFAALLPVVAGEVDMVKNSPVPVASLPEFAAPIADMETGAATMPAPSFRIKPALREGTQNASPAHSASIVVGPVGEVTQEEILSMAKDIYNAFAETPPEPGKAEGVGAEVSEEPVPTAIIAASWTSGSDLAPSGEMAANTTPVEPQPQPQPSTTTVVEIAPEGGALPVNTGAPEDSAAANTPLTPSQNVTINLINRLVQRGLLTKEDAAELIHQAESDAQNVRTQSEAMQAAINQTAAALAQTAPPVTEETVRVSYVPELVKKQIKSEIKDELLGQAKSEPWVATRILPPWVENLHPFADIRVRLEGDFFPQGNDNTGAFPNFNAINTGAPFDVAGNQFSPQYNVDQDRYRIRLRARAGVGFNLGENFSAGLRLATGDSNSPVSQNQSLGLPYQGQGGNFSKYAIWLDRAFIKYELGGETEKNLAISVGRFDNPFFTVSEIMWDNDIGFDGFALQAQYEVLPGFTPFVNGGAFPIYNTDFNFSSNQPAKFPSNDKWLYAGQLGFKWDINRDLELKFGAAYYYFQNVEGKLSSPFTPQSINDAGDTDSSRPSFAQKGNTYMAIRNIVPDASNDFGTINQWQYFGLATPFQDVVLTGRLDYKKFEPLTISLFGEFAKNLAFNQSDINAIAVNNRGPNDDDLSDTIGSFDGGDTAWIVGLQVGHPELLKRWDWNASVGYRYVESDAVIDGFNDSDFGGGGTNLKGYTIATHLALSANVWIGIRWMSAESIAGPTFKEDIIQFDINARF